MTVTRGTVDEAHRLGAEPLDERGAPRVRALGHHENRPAPRRARVADGEASARRKVLVVTGRGRAGRRPGPAAPGRGVAGSPARNAAIRALITVTCICGCGPRSGVRLLTRCDQPSPTSPTVRSSFPSPSTSRSPGAGRRTTSSRVPTSRGTASSCGTKASSSRAVRCRAVCPAVPDDVAALALPTSVAVPGAGPHGCSTGRARPTWRRKARKLAGRTPTRRLLATSTGEHSSAREAVAVASVRLEQPVLDEGGDAAVDLDRVGA